MIKTVIIFVLVLLLCGGAFLSRPGKPAFEAYFRDRVKSGEKNPLLALGLDLVIDHRLAAMQFKDRYLWVQVDENGKTAFVGAFSKFFPIESSAQASTAPDSKPAETKRESSGNSSGPND